MATQINQIDHIETRSSILRVEGDMFHEDAVLLEKIAVNLAAETGNRIAIDIADLDFMDSDAAPILRRLGDLDGFSIEGMEIFLQSAIDSVERHGV